MKAVNKSEEYFLNGFACSQSILLAFSNRFGIDHEIAKRIASTFGGGMGRMRKTCGALTGAFMVLGLKYGNTDPKDMEKKLNSYSKVRELTTKFESIYGTTDCKKIIEQYTDKEGIKARTHHRLICNKLVRTVHEMLELMVDDDARD